MMGGRRRRIGVNKEDDMDDEKRILQFLSDQNGSCTHVEFTNIDNPLGQLTICLMDLISSQYVQDYNNEYILTDQGEAWLAELRAMGENFT